MVAVLGQHDALAFIAAGAAMIGILRLLIR
jgi:hypothetical protein